MENPGRLKKVKTEALSVLEPTSPTPKLGPRGYDPAFRWWEPVVYHRRHSLSARAIVALLWMDQFGLGVPSIRWTCFGFAFLRRPGFVVVAELAID